MRIGIFDPYLDTLGGGEKYMLTVAQCLSSKHEVSILWDPREKHALGSRIKDKFGFDVNFIPFSENIFAARVSLFSRLFLSRRFDLIIFLSDGSIPTVLTRLIIHFQFPVQWMNMSLKTRLKKARIERVICNSKFTKEHIDKKIGVNSQVLYPPIVSVRDERIKKENIIMNVGRYGNYTQGSSYKKQEILIKSFKLMVDKGFLGWKFVVIASTRKEDEKALSVLKKDVHGYPIEIIENPGDDFLRKTYSRAKIYWHAAGYGEDLLIHPERAEHFGISTVEAMTAGAVPIVINAGGQGEIVQDGESGYLWSSLEELRDKTLLIVKDDKLFINISKQAMARSKKFSKERFCGELNRIAG